VNPNDVMELLDSGLTIQKLRSLAKKLGVKLRRTMRKSEIENLIRKKLETKKVRTNMGKETRRVEASSGKIPVEEPKPVEAKRELPRSYNKDKLILLPVNPFWIHAHWDVSERTKKSFESLGVVRKVLRFYDVTYIIFDGSNAHRTFEVYVDLEWRNYYFNVPMPNADYIAVLGYINTQGIFVPVLKSNVVRTPACSPSSAREEVWMKLARRERKVVEGIGMMEQPVERPFGSSPGLQKEYFELGSGGGAFIWRMVRGVGSGGIL